MTAPGKAPTVPCSVCGAATAMTATQLCDPCWESRRKAPSPSQWAMERARIFYASKDPAVTGSVRDWVMEDKALNMAIELDAARAAGQREAIEGALSLLAAFYAGDFGRQTLEARIRALAPAAKGEGESPCKT